MSGRIKNLSAGSASGLIEGENGRRYHFDSWSVLVCDVTYLAVGQLVAFDLEAGSDPNAVNICLQRLHQLPHAERKRKETTLRYLGFDHTMGIRTHRFERPSIGEETEKFAVTADMALFTKHHIGIQEGPALCLHLLMMRLGDAAGDTAALQFQCSLTEEHLLTYLASKPVPGTRPHHKRASQSNTAAANAVSQRSL